MSKSKVVSAPAAPLFTITEAGMASLAREGMATLQRSEAGLGKTWRLTGIHAPSLRAAALAAIVAKCGEEFTAEEARAALEGVHLGSKTPASRIAAFRRAELIAPTAE